MKKNWLILLLLAFSFAFGSIDANAQTEDLYIRAGASGNYYWGEDDCKIQFKNRISPSVNITVGKWFNPYWGVQVGGNYGTIKGGCLEILSGYGTANGLSPYSTGVQAENWNGSKYVAYYEKWKFFTIQPEIVYNVSNGMCGYNEKRVWNLLVHAGPSYGHSFANGYSANSICVTSGLTSTWRLHRNIQLWMDGRFTIFGKDFDKVTYRDDIDFMATLTAGISFNFGK